MFPSLLLQSLFVLLPVAVISTTIQLQSMVPQHAAEPVLESFISFSIEFASFPDFAGNTSHPNKFSYQLIRNLGEIQGSNPIFRVGGNTQDYALYNASQKTALIGTIDPSRNADYPTTVTIGPSFFESYSTWPGVKFIHGFNMAKDGTAGHDSLVATASLACKALSNGKLAYWQLGNEPDDYTTSGQGPVRPANWDENDYVQEWHTKVQVLRTTMKKTCPEMVQGGRFKLVAPSFGGTANGLVPVKTWNAGLNADKDIAMIDGHNYISGATSPGVTLQGTLLNHSATVESISKFWANWTIVAKSSGLPVMMGETNNLYNEGTPSLSNTFGAALWGVDYNLYCASKGIGRVHMHQGTNYRYAEWQPTDTDRAIKGTKAPYYALVMVAHFLGDLTRNKVRVVEIPQDNVYNAAYAAYVDGHLARLAIIQMKEYNATGDDTTGAPPTPGSRPSEAFYFKIPQGVSAQNIKIQRLMADGSDAITGVTFGGYSYNHELKGGQPVILKNVTGAHMMNAGKDRMLSLEVPWSSAVMVSLA